MPKGMGYGMKKERDFQAKMMKAKSEYGTKKSMSPMSTPSIVAKQIMKPKSPNKPPMKPQSPSNAIMAVGKSSKAVKLPGTSKPKMRPMM
jgi:hypothetical protein